MWGGKREKTKLDKKTPKIKTRKGNGAPSIAEKYVEKRERFPPGRGGSRAHKEEKGVRQLPGEEYVEGGGRKGGKRGGEVKSTKSG